MYLFVNILLVLLVGSVFSLKCSDSKSSGNCICKRETHEDTLLPVTLADCRRLDLNSFPEQTLRQDINFLDLSFNNIDKLDPLNGHYANEGLKELIISHNKINYVDSTFFDNVKKLQYLDLSYNEISILSPSSIFESLLELEWIDLSHNNIKMFPDNLFSSMTQLKYFDVSYNPLGEFLKTKDVLNSKLGISNTLTHMLMNGVGVSELNKDFFKQFEKLTHVCLADNDFVIIPDLPTSLEYLDMSGNNMSELTTHYLNFPSLKVLKLNRLSRLTKIHHYAFYELRSVVDISINDCPKLREFNDLVFDDLNKGILVQPKRLSLARNGLEKLNDTYHKLFHKMDHIDLGDNPFVCDCDVVWLQDVADLLYDRSDLRCSSPRRLRDKNILELTKDDLEHCNPGKKSHRILIPILLVGICLLVVLVVYLIYYGPYIKRYGTFTTPGPNSPYSPQPFTDE